MIKAQKKVLVTDYAWENLEQEKEILNKIGAKLVVSTSGEENELIKLAVDVDGILTCWAKVTDRVIEAAKKCQVIGRYGIGLDNIDVEKATQLGILVTNVPTYCVDEVSEHALALLLACARKISFYDRAVKGGKWDLQAGNSMMRLRGKTLGIIGLGKIGRAIVLKAKCFGLRTIAYDPAIGQKEAEKDGAIIVPFDRLLRESDFISVHVPLTESTRGLLGEEEFRKMKDTAFIINTSRGAVVDTKALCKAVEEGWIAGAGLDVLPQEPPEIDDPLLRQENVIITPHAAFSSKESVLELQRTAASQVACVLCGKKPENIVNPEVLKNPKLRASI